MKQHLGRWVVVIVIRWLVLYLGNLAPPRCKNANCKNANSRQSFNEQSLAQKDNLSLVIIIVNYKIVNLHRCFFFYIKIQTRATTNLSLHFRLYFVFYSHQWKNLKKNRREHKKNLFFIEGVARSVYSSKWNIRSIDSSRQQIIETQWSLRLLFSHIFMCRVSTRHV